MPAEIRELVVRVVLDENRQNKSLDKMEVQKLKDSIVKECTEMVISRLETISQR